MLKAERHTIMLCRVNGILSAQISLFKRLCRGLKNVVELSKGGLHVCNAMRISYNYIKSRLDKFCLIILATIHNSYYDHTCMKFGLGIIVALHHFLCTWQPRGLLCSVY